MFYPKNVPNIERGIRIMLGLVIIGAALIANLALPLAGILIASAVFIMATGFVGWCPACAMVGRKLKNKQQQ